MAAIVTHLCRVFFTGAFRRPREVNWIIGVTLLLLVLANGFTGYSLPDDLLSGTGLRIAYSIALAVPVVGTWAAFLVFGGEFPAPDILGRLFVLHVLFVPAAITALLGAHLAILWRQKHTQFPDPKGARGPVRTEHNIVGSHLWPTYAARSVGLFAAVFGVIALLGGLVQINPIWLYGPFEPAAVSTASQPDWYMGWLEGALRLFPAWRVHAFGFTLSELFWPGVLLPGVTFGLLYLWPFLEARLTGDHAVHHLLDRPRQRAWRTAIGTSVLSFYVVLFVAGSQDIGAQKLAVSIPTVTWTLRVLLVTVPIVVFAITIRLCHDLVGVEDLEATKHRLRSPGSAAPSPSPSATIARSPGRRFVRAVASSFLLLATSVASWFGRRRRRRRRARVK
jgi:ubiquinol-cytochrome c reductase cytochrome b subunit